MVSLIPLKHQAHGNLPRMLDLRVAFWDALAWCFCRYVPNPRPTFERTSELVSGHPHSLWVRRARSWPPAVARG